MALDSLSSYSRDTQAQLRTMMMTDNSVAPASGDKLISQEQVRKAMEAGQVDKLIVQIKEEQEKETNTLFWFLLSKIGGGFTAAFLWPQQMIQKHFRTHKTQAPQQSTEEKRADIKKEVNKLRGQPSEKEINEAKGNAKQEVGVGVGNGKIVAGSLEWQMELDRIAEMARVAQMIGSQRLMRVILDILLETLRITQAKEAAISTLEGAAGLLERMAESIQAAYERMLERLETWLTPKIDAMADLYERASEALRKSLDKLAEKAQKRVQAIEEAVKDKCLALAEWLQPPIMKVVEPIREIWNWGIDRMHDAQEVLRGAVEKVMTNAEIIYNAVANFIHTSVPNMVVHSIGWVYGLSPTTFNAIGYGFKGTYQAAVALGKWLGSRAKQTYQFLKKMALRALKAIQEALFAVANRMYKAWLRFKMRALAFLKKCYRLCLISIRWTVATTRSLPYRLKQSIYKIFHLSKHAAGRLALELERKAKR